MSGRSAHVRKKQGPKESNKKAVVVNSFYEVADQLPSPPKRSASSNTQSRPSFGQGANSYQQNGHPYGQNGMNPYGGQRLPPAYTSTSQVSTSSSGSAANSGSKASLPKSSGSGTQYVQSAIEKSSFRAFMDSKSDKFREKLSKTMGANSTQKPDSAPPFRPASVLTNHTDNAHFDAAPPGSSNGTVRARMVRSPDGLGMQYDNVHASRQPRNKIYEELTPKRWLGGGRAPHAWNKMKRDPELWDPTGDTLVFFGHDTHQSARPPASFRIHSDMLRNTGSAFLITILDEGEVYNSDYNISASPINHYANSQDSNESFQFAQSQRRNPNMHGMDREAPAVYEVYFPAPLHQSKSESLKHHMTTRNVFALLMDKSLVGFTFGQALMDLHERLEMYLPPDADITGKIIEYITTKGIDDVRNDPATAAGLLVWCESPVVKWQEGWLEAFVHCSGMLNRLTSLPEWREISAISRQLIERASLDLQVRVHDVEDRLATFNFTDMWPVTSAIQPAARASFDRFQKFLLSFYSQAYWSWPPPLTNDGEIWLTRDLAIRLQKDFGALYDYLVDRDIVWDESEERSTRKWKIVSRSGQSGFRADSNDLPITDIFVAFDNRHRFPHIPHPFPLLPDSQPLPAAQKASLFQKKQKTPDDRAAERKAALAYSNATNINLLGSGFGSNELVEAFIKFEKSDRPSESDPYDARRGRWILLYGLLQVVATVSVDTPGVRWTEDLQYFINPRLRGVPPWQNPGELQLEEATHQGSHCWVVPRTWGRSPASSQGDALSESLTEPQFDRRKDSNAQRAWDDQTATQQRHGNGNGAIQGQRQAPMQLATESHPEGNGLLAGSESDDVATTITSNIGGQRAKDWVNSGGGYAGATGDTVAIRSQKEKVREWPIQNFRPAHGEVTRSKGPGSVSSYRPPSEW